MSNLESAAAECVRAYLRGLLSPPPSSTSSHSLLNTFSDSPSSSSPPATARVSEEERNALAVVDAILARNGGNGGNMSSTLQRRIPERHLLDLLSALVQGSPAFQSFGVTNALLFRPFSADERRNAENKPHSGSPKSDPLFALAIEDGPYTVASGQLTNSRPIPRDLQRRKAALERCVSGGSGAGDASTSTSSSVSALSGGMVGSATSLLSSLSSSEPLRVRRRALLSRSRVLERTLREYMGTSFSQIGSRRQNGSRFSPRLPPSWSSSVEFASSSSSPFAMTSIGGESRVGEGDDDGNLQHQQRTRVRVRPLKQAPGEPPLAAFPPLLPLARVRGHTSSVYCIVLDMSGDFIITGGDDWLIKVWDASNGRVVRSLRGHKADIADLAVHRSNRILVSASTDTDVRLWDLQNYLPICIIAEHQAQIATVFFRDEILFTSDVAGTIRLWSIAPLLDPLLFADHVFSSADLRMSGVDVGSCVANFARELDALATTTLAPSGGKRGRAGGLKASIPSALAPANAAAGAASTSASAAAANPAANGAAAPADAEDPLSMCFHISPGNRWLVNSWGAKLVVWSICPTKRAKNCSSAQPEGVRFIADQARRALRVQAVLGGHQKRVRSLCFNNRGDAIASGADDGMVRVWRRQGFTTHARNSGAAKSVLAPALSSWDSCEINMLLDRGAVVFGDKIDYQSVSLQRLHPRERDAIKRKGLTVCQVVWTQNDSHVIASADHECVGIKVFRILEEPAVYMSRGRAVDRKSRPGAECVAQFIGHRRECYAILMHPLFERVVVSCGYDGRICIWDYVTGTALSVRDTAMNAYLATDPEVRDALLGRVGSSALGFENELELDVHRPRLDEPLVDLDVATSSILEARFSLHPDGRRFICSDADGFLHIYGMPGVSDFSMKPFLPVMQISEGEQFFSNDYREQVWDLSGHAADAATHTPVMMAQYLPLLGGNGAELPVEAQMAYRLKPIPVVQFNNSSLSEFSGVEIPVIDLRFEFDQKDRFARQELLEETMSAAGTFVSFDSGYAAEVQDPSKLTSRQRTLRGRTRFEQALNGAPSIDDFSEIQVEDNDDFLGVDDALEYADAVATAVNALEEARDDDWEDYSGSSQSSEFADDRPYRRSSRRRSRISYRVDSDSDLGDGDDSDSGDRRRGRPRRRRRSRRKSEASDFQRQSISNNRDTMTERQRMILARAESRNETKHQSTHGRSQAAVEQEYEDYTSSSGSESTDLASNTRPFGLAAVPSGWATWLTTCIPDLHQTEFVPQVGDTVAFFRQGYFEYLRRYFFHINGTRKSVKKTSKRTKAASAGRKRLPAARRRVLDYWQQKSREFELQDNETCFVKRIVYCVDDPAKARVTLMLLNHGTSDGSAAAASASAPGANFSTSIDYPEVDYPEIDVYYHAAEVADFMVLAVKAQRALAHDWEVMDRFQMRYPGDPLIYEGCITSIQSKSSKFPRSPWERFHVVFDSRVKKADAGHLSQALVTGEDSVPSSKPMFLNSPIFVPQDDAAKQEEAVSPWEIVPIGGWLQKDARKVTAPDEKHMPDVAARVLLSNLDLFCQLPQFALFIHRVDPSEVPAYTSVVGCPMDLDTLAQRLNYRFYRRIEAFEADMRLIATNAAAFNEGSSEIVKSARLLEGLLEAAVALARAALSDLSLEQLSAQELNSGRPIPDDFDPSKYVVALETYGLTLPRETRHTSRVRLTLEVPLMPRSLHATGAGASDGDLIPPAAPTDSSSDAERKFKASSRPVPKSPRNKVRPHDSRLTIRLPAGAFVHPPVSSHTRADGRPSRTARPLVRLSDEQAAELETRQATAAAAAVAADATSDDTDSSNSSQPVRKRRRKYIGDSDEELARELGIPIQTGPPSDLASARGRHVIALVRGEPSHGTVISTRSRGDTHYKIALEHGGEDWADVIEWL